MLIRFIKRQCSSSEARKILLWIEMNEENKAHFTHYNPYGLPPIYALPYKMTK